MIFLSIGVLQRNACILSKPRTNAFKNTNAANTKNALTTTNALKTTPTTPPPKPSTNPILTASSIAHLLRDIPVLLSSYAYCLSTSTLVQRWQARPDASTLRCINAELLAAALQAGGRRGGEAAVQRLQEAAVTLVQVLAQVRTA